jgi:integrase/recombinase XerD
MYNHSINGITISSILDNRRELKDSLYPIKIRVTFKRDRKYYATGQSLSEIDWKKIADAKSKRITEIKGNIQHLFNKVKVNVEDLVKADNFSLDMLSKRLGQTSTDTIDQALNLRSTELFEKGKISSSELNKYTLKSIKLYAGDNIKFKNIHIDWLRGYEAYLLKEKRSYTTISIYMRTIQAIINSAIEAGIYKQKDYPFGKNKYEIPEHIGRNMALTLPEISKIVSFSCDTPVRHMYRDLWVFSYLCNGANVTDLCKLKFSNIKDGEICFYRQKTIAKTKKKKEIQAILTQEMQVIIKKWGNTVSTSEDVFIFPFLKGDESPFDERRVIKNITRLMNNQMSKISKSLNLPNISSYTARHSFATVLKRSGANIAYISESLGHSELRTTENYLAKFEKEERIKNASALTAFAAE